MITIAKFYLILLSKIYQPELVNLSEIIDKVHISDVYCYMEEYETPSFCFE